MIWTPKVDGVDRIRAAHINALQTIKVDNDCSEWLYLSGQDQALKTTSSPEFVAIYLPRTVNAVTGIIFKDDGAGTVRPFLHDYTGGLPGNVFLGELCGNFALTGPHNTGLGYGCLYDLTTGDNNTGVGHGSVYRTTIGNGNTGVGTDALRENISGEWNTAIGHAALAATTIASRNTAIGESAIRLGNGATLIHNTAIGAFALQAQLTGGYNCAVGSQALYSATAPEYTTAIGYGALYNATTPINNTAIGYNAGYSMVADNNSVFIGFCAGYYAVEEAVLYIDDRPRASEADAKVKALIYGHFADLTANQNLWINGKFGVLLSEIPAAENNAAAQAAGLAVGQFYRTNADPSVLCIRSA